MLGLAATSYVLDLRESNACRGKGIRDAVVVPVATSVYQSVGLGFRLELGHRGKRTAHFCGKDYRLRAGCQSLQPDSNSLVGAPGREASILTEQARASRDHAPRFLGSGNTGKARQRNQYPAPGDAWQWFRRRPAHIVRNRTAGNRQVSRRNPETRRKRPEAAPAG